jgi:cytoskeletal protein RodZ
MKFGESLRKERELRGITLEEISKHTKVHTRFLQAIEHDDLSVLPAKAFAKGFLRSYARMVGLDEDQVITNFEYCHQALQPEEYSDTKIKYPSEPPRHRLVFLVLLLIIMALAGVLILYYQGYLHLDWLNI